MIHPKIARWCLAAALLAMVARPAAGSDHNAWFQPRGASLSDRLKTEFRWRDPCQASNDNHTLGSGFESAADSRCFLAVGTARVNGRQRPGLLMLAFPDVNVLRASWDVDLPEDEKIALEFALPDLAAQRTTNGLKFSVIATDDQGAEHVLLEQQINKGDNRVHQATLGGDFPIKKITLIHDNLGEESWDVLWVHPVGFLDAKSVPKVPGLEEEIARRGFQVATLRAAIEDLRRTYPQRYPRGAEYLRRLDELMLKFEAVRDAPLAIKHQSVGLAWDVYVEQLKTLARRALLDNPLLRDHPILFVTRHQYLSNYSHAIDTLYVTDEDHTILGFPNKDAFQGGGALKMLDLANGGSVRVLLHLPDGVVRDPDVHFDAGKVICSVRRHADEDYHLCEISLDGNGLRRLTSAELVADFDPIYMPDDSIVFASTREPKYNMCSRDLASDLYRMNADGSNIRQITKNTLFEHNPVVMPDGRLLYHRWEYVDRNFGDAHGLWTVNPDGTNQAVYWGSNTAVPAGIYNPQPIPGTHRVLCTFGPHHDCEWGALAIVDRRLGVDGRPAVVRTWPADFIDKVRVAGGFDCDTTVHAVPVKYEDPWPLSEKYFLCSRMTRPGGPMGIYLVDTFGNETLVHAELPGCYDPMPVHPRQRPPRITSSRNAHDSHGTVFVADVYRGTHMQGVARGAVKYLRVVESPEKRHWAIGLWGGQGFTSPGMNWHSLENKRILGTVPVEEDGSVHFTVPAGRFVYFQLLDENGMMIQSMRSGTVVQSGETVGCVGCHEHRLSTPLSKASMLTRSGKTPTAWGRSPQRLDDQRDAQATPSWDAEWKGNSRRRLDSRGAEIGWFGPPRLFGFMREVQPVFDRHCVSCHDFDKPAAAKLNLAADRGLMFNAAYVELHRKGYVRCVGGGPAEHLAAYSWGSHASRLIEELRAPKVKEHAELRLNPEDFARIATWIDLNGVYYPTYACAWPASCTGRTPLSAQQSGRLESLLGFSLQSVMNHGTCPGVLVSFDRPELSPCLSRFGEEDDARRREVVELLQTASKQLADRPRADMPGFIPCEADRRREQKYAFRRREELRNRRAAVQGQKAYDPQR